MSIKLMSAAWDLDIPSTEKMVLLCLCDFANDDGDDCWPSVPTIAKKASKDSRTVQRALRWLEAEKFLTRMERSGTSTKYHLDPRHITTPVKLSPVTKPTEGGDTTPPNPPRPINKKRDSAHEIDETWTPSEFGKGTKCRKIIEHWKPEELEHQLEHFIAHHRTRQNKFPSWQDAWKTWVLNSDKFKGYGNGTGNRNGTNNKSGSGDGLFDAAARQLAAASSGRDGMGSLPDYSGT